MKTALNITLLISCLSLLMAMFGALIFYADWVGKSQYQATFQIPHFAESDYSSQDLDTLKRTCHNLAQSLDLNIMSAHLSSILAQRFNDGFAWFALVWGLGSGIQLLRVHFLLRRIAKNNDRSGT